jgi:hypothetical protein
MAQELPKPPKSPIKATTKAPDPRELQIPDSVIERIMEAMKIPDEEWDPAVYKVSSAVQSCVESFIDGRLGEHENRYQMIASLCDRLRLELSKLNNSERRHFSANLQDFEESLASVRRAVGYRIPTQRSRNRPRDTIKDPHILDLIRDLFVVTVAHGGRLTLSKDLAATTTKGSLQAILDILHDLSPVIFPSDLAFNTLKDRRLRVEGSLEDEALYYLSYYWDEDERSVGS